MTQDDQRKYWRDKQRESRMRRRAKNKAQTAPATPRREVVFTPAPATCINANIHLKASVEEIAALGASRAAAFMNGVAQVIAAMNPDRP